MFAKALIPGSFVNCVSLTAEAVSKAALLGASVASDSCLAPRSSQSVRSHAGGKQTGQ